MFCLTLRLKLNIEKCRIHMHKYEATILSSKSVLCQINNTNVPRLQLSRVNLVLKHQVTLPSLRWMWVVLQSWPFYNGVNVARILNLSIPTWVGNLVDDLSCFLGNFCMWVLRSHTWGGQVLILIFFSGTELLPLNILNFDFKGKDLICVCLIKLAAVCQLDYL